MRIDRTLATVDKVPDFAYPATTTDALKQAGKGGRNSGDLEAKMCAQAFGQTGDLGGDFIDAVVVLVIDQLIRPKVRAMARRLGLPSIAMMLLIPYVRSTAIMSSPIGPHP